MIGVVVNPSAGDRRSWLAAAERARRRWERVRSFNIPAAIRSRIAKDFVQLIRNDVTWGKVSWTYQFRYYITYRGGMYGSEPAGSGLNYWGRINPQERLDKVGWEHADRGPRFLEAMQGRFQRSGSATAEVQILTYALMNPYAKDKQVMPIMHYFRYGWHSVEEKKRMRERPVDKWLVVYQYPRLRSNIVDIWRQAWKPLMTEF